MALRRLRRVLTRALGPRGRVVAFKARYGLYPPQRALVRAFRGIEGGRVVGEPIVSLADVLDETSVAEALAGVLAQQQVDHAVMRVPGSSVPLIAIGAESWQGLARGLSNLPSAHSWLVRVGHRRKGKWRAAPRAALEIDGSTSDLRVRRTYRLRDGQTVWFLGVSEVRIQLWDRLNGGEERADGEPHLPGTRLPRSPNAVTPYLVEELWEQLCAGKVPDVPALAQPSIFEVVEPIDVVYTWVDGADPRWQERKRAAIGQPEGGVNRTADADSRFASHDELRYSLRSLEAFAPWVRHIFLVTDQQTPEWLLPDHPRISVVDHRDIFTDTSGLPVYNSHAIESQLHHIPGLSDRYLYMNDDVFFGRAVRPELFFHANGVSRFFLSRAMLDVSPVSARDLPVLSAAKHNAELISEAFGRSITRKFMHTPHALSRAVLAEMEERFPEVFHQLARSRIRHPNDHSVSSALHHYYAYATGRAVPGSIRYGYVNLSDPEAELTLLRFLRSRDRDAFCLNDTFTDSVGHARADELSAWFLERYFPLPSSFERPDAAASVTAR